MLWPLILALHEEGRKGMRGGIFRNRGCRMGWEGWKLVSVCFFEKKFKVGWRGVAYQTAGYNGNVDFDCPVIRE